MDSSILPYIYIYILILTVSIIWHESCLCSHDNFPEQCMLRRTSYNWCAVLHGDGPWWCVGRSPWAWCAAVCWAEPCAWGLQTAGQTTGRRPEGDRIVRSGVTHRQKMASAQLPPTNSLPSGEARGVWVSTQPTWWAYWHSFSIVQAGDT